MSIFACQKVLRLVKPQFFTFKCVCMKGFYRLQYYNIYLYTTCHLYNNFQ